MGKKYLDTKKGSLEQSVLGVWKTAVEEGSGRMDGRTSEYREHRKKLESARSRRESTKTESYEIGTDEYRKYLEKLTPAKSLKLKRKVVAKKSIKNSLILHLKNSRLIPLLILNLMRKRRNFMII